MMDGLIFLHDQAGRSLAQAMQQIEALRAEIDSLSAENAALRDQIAQSTNAR